MTDIYINGVKQVPSDHDRWTEEQKTAYALDCYDEAVRASGEGAYVVTSTPEDPSLNALWVGWATNPVDALNQLMDEDQFAHYVRPTDPEQDFSVCPYALNDQRTEWGACAVFLNGTIYARLISPDLRKEDVV